MSVSAPSRSDPVARMASAIVGGPAGRRLAAAGFWRALPVLVLMASLTMIGAVLTKQHCRAEGWSTPDHFWHACYSDIPVLYVSESLGTSARPSLMDALGPQGLGQPPLAGTAMWLVSGVVDATSEVRGRYEVAVESRRFLDVSAGGLTAVLIAAVIAVALAAGRRRRWDAAHLAVSPVLLGTALISYDLLAVALVAGTFWAWSRSRPVAAGVLLGLAATARPVAAVVGFALLGLCLRAGALRVWLVSAGAGLAAWVGVRVILFPHPVQALSDTWQGWKESGPGYGSLWLIPSLFSQSQPTSASWWYTGEGIGGPTSTMITLLGLLVVGVATVAVALLTPYRPRVAHLALFALATGLLVIKSLPPQLGLLLLPLIALAGLRWRDHLIWATAELAYFVGVWLYIAAADAANRGLPAGFYLVLILVRCSAIGWLAVQAVRAARDPVQDPVRVPVDEFEPPPDADDPAAGPIASRPDALLAR